VFVQFSGSVTTSGSATYRIGTTSATEVNIEECNGCGLSGWQWQDNGWGTGVLGPRIYFATTGVHRIRVQTREDGLSIDRIVLSPSTYMSSAPGSSSSGGSSSGDTSGDTGGSTSGSTTTLKVLHWNIHHGVGTDGVYDIDTIASWIARTGANVVSLNEVEKYTGWGNEDQPARFASLLRSRTGRTWYYNFAQRDGGTNGQGNLLLTIFPIDSSADHQLSYSRSVAQIRLTINGRTVNIFSTHLDADSSSRRTTQINELKSWASTFPEQRIIAGDFNAWPSLAEISLMTSGHYDTWAVARANGTAVAYPGNEEGNTRNSRIDYIFQSKGATLLVVKASQVFDTRDSSGVAASDHKPLMTTFTVR
jgi:endonuclease/exonuclease/phosphatase family metal-dependent hydrolase